MTVIDVHTHVIPRFVADEASSSSVFGVTEADGWLVHPQGFRYPLHAELIDPAAKLAQMDVCRIEISVISCSPTLFFYDAPADEAVAFARRVNDAIAVLAREEPRFEGLALLPLQDPEAAAAELERSVGELGLRGAHIGTSCGTRPLDSPELEPVLATAAALRAPLLLHPYYVGPKAGLEDFYFTNSIGNPLDTCVAAARLIHAGVFDRFPTLRVVLAHGAGFLPYQVGRFDHAFAVRSEPRVVIQDLPSSYLKRFWIDTITHDDRALAFLAQLAGADRLVLGTDLPFDMADADAVDRVARSGLDCHALGETARELFGITPG
jgi:aminocarboxymuconate-semialdehyde decarboxylase